MRKIESSIRNNLDLNPALTQIIVKLLNEAYALGFADGQIELLNSMQKKEQ